MFNYSSFYRWHEFFWKKRLEKFAQWHAKYECIDSSGGNCSFVYSLYGTLTGQAANYMFYETTATIITLVFLGNYMEDASSSFHTKSIEQTGKVAEGNGQYDRVMMISTRNKYFLWRIRTKNR